MRVAGDDVRGGLTRIHGRPAPITQTEASWEILLTGEVGEI